MERRRKRRAQRVAWNATRKIMKVCQGLCLGVFSSSALKKKVHFVESTCFVLSSSDCNAGSPGLPPVPLTARESHREREDLGGSGSSIASGPASARNGSGSRSGSRGLAPKEKGKPPMPKVGRTLWSVSYLLFSLSFFVDFVFGCGCGCGCGCRCRCCCCCCCCWLK